MAKLISVHVPTGILPCNLSRNALNWQNCKEFFFLIASRPLVPSRIEHAGKPSGQTVGPWLTMI